MDEQPGVGRKAVRAMRRVVRYCGTEPLPLRVAVAMAIAARHVGGGVAVGYRDRWCDGQDPSELFLLGVDPGNDVMLEATGPRAGELLDELQRVLEHSATPATSRESDPDSNGPDPG
ncbi:MAG: HPr family phosphocarrier protein [Planctomycetes bacterium]|nr:HPr family phosphocarrier protein [Planctomycetota bacterium]